MSAALDLPLLDDVEHHRSGDVIAGKYLLERMLGEGGMGCVWLAHNIDLDTSVAIKLVRPEIASEAGDRLKREARVTARIDHRAVVRIFDFGETSEGHPFIVMELLEGVSFADVLDEKGPLTPVSAVKLLLPIVDGLAAAHELGIVHRDIKPENIFLARVGRRLQPKVVDFGIAKLELPDPNESISIAGMVIGSPSYMAPEQARGLSDVDHRADIWALCAVLYGAVSGKPPFRGASNYNALLRRIVEEPVTPLEGSEDQAGLWSILARGLEKDRSQRFQSMRALGRSLAVFLTSRGVTEDSCGDPLAATWAPRGSVARSDPGDQADASPRPGSRLLLVTQPSDTALETIEASDLPTIRAVPAFVASRPHAPWRVALASDALAMALVAFSALAVQKDVGSPRAVARGGGVSTLHPVGSTASPLPAAAPATAEPQASVGQPAPPLVEPALPSFVAIAERREAPSGVGERTAPSSRRGGARVAPRRPSSNGVIADLKDPYR